MKAKLHKMVSGYIVSLNGDIDDPYAIVNEELAKDHEWYRLSLRNCQAIELDYDLDELAEKVCPDVISSANSAYKAGFQKALEILGDNKFSERDIEKSIIWAHDKSTEGVYLSRLPITDFIQSLQQTEWEVEIVTFTEDDLKSVSEDWGKLGKPKLDKEGCLILKKL